MKQKARLIAALKIWVVIYPSIMLFQFLFSNQIAALQLYQRTFLLTAALVPWVVFVGVPLLDAAVRGFSTRRNKAA